MILVMTGYLLESYSEDFSFLFYVFFPLQAVTPGGEASITSLVDLINVLPSLQNVEQSGLTVDEEACGRLLEASVSQGCGIPKAWLALAAWAYKLGRRTVDKSR